MAWALLGWLLFLVLGILVVKIGVSMWWKPLQIRKMFESQGIRGPPYRILYGNMLDMLRIRDEAMSRPTDLTHDIIPRALSFYDSWTKRYGKNFIHWFGATPRLSVTDPELIWEVLCNKSGMYKKSNQMKHLNGDGLVSLEGELWAHHRRIINPAFHLEHLKVLVPEILESTKAMLERWEEKARSGEKEIEICKEFRGLTEELLAYTIFGGAHAQGKRIFDMQAQQATLATEIPRNFLYACASWFLPSKRNRQIKSLEKQIRRSLREMIQSKQRESCGLGRSGMCGGGDLLSVMSGCNREKDMQMIMSIEEIIDECQTFFFAGHDTTLCLLVWTVVLLAMHPQWQERARREILSVCGQNIPHAQSLHNLKLMGMILNESLRLYPPVVALIRQTNKDMKLGQLRIPAGTQLLFPIIALHHDSSLWGENSKEFDPERFREGISKAAKHPMAFMPFGMGPRICVGQNFALLQAKIILTMILQRFSFSLAPTYRHAPIPLVFLQPQFGAQITVDPL